MLSKVLLLGFIACANAFSVSFISGLYNQTIGGINPTTVQNVDLKAYMGTWLQMGADKVVLSTFEKDAYCATATYGLMDDGKVSVHNYALIGSTSGSVYTIDGYAYAEDPKDLSKLKVHFNSGGAPFDAPYWILSLGPIVNGQYEWAIVSDNLSLTLFVLARNANTYNTQYKSTVDAELKTLGFTGFKKMIDIVQSSDCKYDHPVSPSASKALVGAEKSKTPCKHSVGLGGLWSGLFGSSETVTSLDIPAYMGLWYQMYGNGFVWATTSGEHPTCATALYALKSDGHVSVHNYELLKGAVTTIDGYAYQPDASKPGQLKLHIDSVPMDGPYYIYALGPIVNGLYDWAVVSDPFKLSLFILARDPAVYMQKYDKEVLALVESLGFTSSMSKPQAVPQGPSCTYESN